MYNALYTSVVGRLKYILLDDVGGLWVSWRDEKDLEKKKKK